MSAIKSTFIAESKQWEVKSTLLQMSAWPEVARTDYFESEVDAIIAADKTANQWEKNNSHMGCLIVRRQLVWIIHRSNDTVIVEVIKS